MRVILAFMVSWTDRVDRQMAARDPASGRCVLPFLEQTGIRVADW